MGGGRGVMNDCGHANEQGMQSTPVQKVRSGHWLRNLGRVSSVGDTTQ